MSIDVPQGWSRPYHQPGGGRPFLFYVVFGESSGQLDLNSADVGLRRLPQGLEISLYDRQRHGEWIDGWFKDYLGRTLAEEQPRLSIRVRSATRVVVLRGEFPDSGDLLYLRDTLKLVGVVAKDQGAGILDPQSFSWYSTDEWEQNSTLSDAVAPRRHVAILTSEEESPLETVWVHTRGMRKFGRPDLSVHGVTAERLDAVVGMCNRFIEMQALGAIIPEGQEVRMNALPPGGICCHSGSLDDPDFNNVHLEIRWPRT